MLSTFLFLPENETFAQRGGYAESNTSMDCHPSEDMEVDGVVEKALVADLSQVPQPSASDVLPRRPTRQTRKRKLRAKAAPLSYPLDIL
jgi:hypothetical protein